MNKKMRSEFFYVKKRQNSGQNSQKALGIPLPFQWGQLRLVWYLNDFTNPIHANVNVHFAGRGPGQGCLVNRFGSWFGMNAKLLRGAIDPLSMLNDYVNTVFNVVVSLCKCPPTVHTGRSLTCCNSLPACNKSFLTRKEYAICGLLR